MNLNLFLRIMLFILWKKINTITLQISKCKKPKEAEKNKKNN